MKLTDDPEWTVHHGFNDALHEVWGDSAITRDMRLTIKAFQDKAQTIWFCGHSLGAALAALAAAEYVIKDGGTTNGVYTIGQPRIGNSKFAARFDDNLRDKCFRFVNNNDIVPRLPIWTPIQKYTHPGNSLYFDSKGDLWDSISWWKKLWDELKGVKGAICEPGIDAFEDHKSDHYVSLMNKNRGKSTKWS